MFKFLITFWLEKMLLAGTKSFFGIGQGPTREEKDIFGLLRGMANFEFGAGQKGVSQSQGYWSDILSGDPNKIAQAISPETKVIQGRAQQRKNQLAEFGTRSGGTAAKAASIDTEATSAIQELVNRLRPEAASALSGQGLALLGLGGSSATSAFGAAATMQQQEAAKWNDIFSSISKVMEGLAPFLKGTAGKIVSAAGGAMGG